MPPASRQTNQWRQTREVPSVASWSCHGGHSVPRETSLAHAESAEDFPKHLFDADCAGDASKRLSRPPQVFGAELEFLHGRAQERGQCRSAPIELLAVPGLCQHGRLLDLGSDAGAGEGCEA